MKEVVGTEHVITREDQAMMALQNVCLKETQVEIGFSHRFRPGEFERTMHVPAGTLVVGKRQRTSAIHLLTKGRVVMYQGKGKPGKEISAPYVYISDPWDKKMGVFVEDTEWTAIYLNPSEERNVDKLMGMLTIPDEEYHRLQLKEV